MEFTAEVSKAFNTTPFLVFEQNADDVIMLINYFIEKSYADGDSHAGQGVKKTSNKKSERIKVNSKTATGGWW